MSGMDIDETGPMRRQRDNGGRYAKPYSRQSGGSNSGGRRRNNNDNEGSFNSTYYNGSSSEEVVGSHGAGSNADRWSHDMFSSIADSAPSTQYSAAAVQVSRSSGAGGNYSEVSNTEQAVRVSNLHWKVSVDDLKELFGFELGLVKSIKLRYDHAGRSEGIADVVFTSVAAAEKSIAEYNDRPLDGMEMRLEKVITIVPLAKRLGPAPTHKPASRGSITNDAVAASSSAATSGDSNRSGGQRTAGRREPPKRQLSVFDRLEKSLDERLGKLLDDRLGEKVDSSSIQRSTRGGRRGEGSNAADRPRGGMAGSKWKKNEATGEDVQARDLDADLDTYMGRRSQRKIISYADASEPANVSMD